MIILRHVTAAPGMIDSGDAAEQTGVADSSERGRIGQINIQSTSAKAAQGAQVCQIAH